MPMAKHKHWRGPQAKNARKAAPMLEFDGFIVCIIASA